MIRLWHHSWAEIILARAGAWRRGWVYPTSPSLMAAGPRQAGGTHLLGVWVWRG